MGEPYNLSVLARRIASERVRRGWNQKELAARIRVGQQTVSKWESDGAVPKNKNLMRLAEIFDIDLQELQRLAFEASLMGIADEEDDEGVATGTGDLERLAALESKVEMILDFLRDRWPDDAPGPR